MITDKQIVSFNRISKEHQFKSDFTWWIDDKNKELFLRLDDFTVFGVHPSGLVTEHTASVDTSINDEIFQANAEIQKHVSKILTDEA